MLITYDFNEEGYEIRISDSDLIEFLKETFTEKDLKDVLKEYDDTIDFSDVDVGDVIIDIVYNNADQIFEDYYDDIKEYFEEDAYEDYEDSKGSNDFYSYYGVSRYWFK